MATNVIQLSEEEKVNYAGQSLLQLAIRRLRRDRLTLIAAAVFITVTVLSILAPFIESTFLKVSYARTDPNNAFIAPGSQERLAFLPDYRTAPSTLQVIVLTDKGKNAAEVGEVDVAVTAAQIGQTKGTGGLLVFNVVPDGPALSATLNEESKPVVGTARVAEKPTLNAVAPGTYTLTLRPVGNADAAPLKVIEGVEIKEGSLTSLVVYGRASEQNGVQAQAFTTGVSELTKEQSRVQVIHASQTAPVARVLQGNDVIIDNLAYGSAETFTAAPARINLGISDVNARTHTLGTDDLGRDQLSRLIYAGQVSLGIAFFAALISISIGVTLGTLTGFYGGLFDDAVNWLITTLTSLPFLLLLLIIVAVFNPGPLTLVMVLGLLGWTGTCRLVRGETFSLRAREYIVSARAIGAPVSRILLVHILPNLFSVVIINLALDIGGLILTESALSFLGFGIKPPTPSWGNMLSNAQTFFTKGAHLVIWPGLLISTTVLCLFVIGDGLRDAFDPTLKN